MRKSKKVLLSAAGILVGGIVIVAAMARMALSQIDPSAVNEARQPRESPGRLVSESYDLEGFRDLEVEGAWRVSVTQGDDWQVQVAYPEAYEDEVDVSVRGDQLRLERNTSRRWRWWGRDDFPVTAKIVMPELARLSAAGANDLEFAGFTGARLEIDVAGATQIEGRDGVYDEIELSIAGANQIDLQGVIATDARVDSAGATGITLTLDGGILSCSMAGAGSLDYYGTVASQRVDIAGIGRVRPAN
jgi:hypothetical protein